MATQRSTVAHERKREELLDIVARLINVNGASNATLSAVADELGVKHNTLYYYFKDRNELHRTVLYRTLELRASSLSEAFHLRGNAFERLTRYLEIEILAELHSRVDPARGSALKGPVRERFLKAWDKHVLNLSELIADGITEGSLAPCDPYVRAVTIEAILTRFINMDEIIAKGSNSREEIGRLVIDILSHGILTPRRRMPKLPQPEADITEILGFDLDAEDIEGRELQFLLSNAARAFNENGWNASIPAMAARIGKSKTVYYQFATDKSELWYQCLSRGIAMVAASQRESSRTTDSTAEAIAIHYQYMYRAHDSAIGPFPVHSDLDRLRPQHRRLISTGNHGLRFRGQRRVRNAVAEGWFKPFPPNIVQPLFGSMLYKLGAGFLDRKGGVNYTKAAIENTCFVFEGMGTDRFGR